MGMNDRERGGVRLADKSGLIQNFGLLYHHFTSNGTGHYSWIPLLWEIYKGKADQRIPRETYSGRDGWAEIECSPGGRR
jgi:hypothetical protein